MKILQSKIPSNWPYQQLNVCLNSKIYNNIKFTNVPNSWQVESNYDLTIIESKQGYILKKSFGRGTVFQCESLVLRQYYRGGIIKYFNSNRYFGIKRFKNEYDIHKTIWLSGIPTVQPIGWGYTDVLFGTKGIFLSKFSDGIPWPNNLDCSEHVLKQLYLIIKSLCRWGLYAPDLNATNILIRPNNELLVIDWDRTHWVNNKNLMKCYRNRLIRSLKKLGIQQEILSRVHNYLVD